MRVFVSYSHDSNLHIERVLALADRLRTDGLDVRIDQYISHPAEGWRRWMHDQLRDSDFTLLVCTALYRRRFEGDESQGMITQQILEDANPLNTKLIPVIFEDAEYEDIPLTLRSFTHHRLLAGYEDLHRHITGQSKIPAARPGLHVDNRGANIGQVINVNGIANIGLPPPRPAAIRPRASILLFTANATHPEDRLDLEAELRAILDSLARARARDHYDPRISPAVTFARVVHDLDDHNPTIVHFGGHGDRSGNIILRTDQGRENPVSPDLVARMFASLRTPPRLAVFATCNSERLARAASAHVGHAIGFTEEVADTTARQFSTVLYERLASREDLDIPRAFTQAQLATIGSGYPDADLARLFPPHRIRVGM
jgi:hypothetical protein